MALKTLEIVTCTRPHIDIFILVSEEVFISLAVGPDRLLVVSVDESASNVV